VTTAHYKDARERQRRRPDDQAVHVAAAIRGGASLSGIQMRNTVEALGM
jgi:hypothetical protein